nr:lipoyl(octanoyl) transferase LipB [Sphingomonas sp. CARO-RG-8B-R24-01]
MARQLANDLRSARDWRNRCCVDHLPDAIEWRIATAPIAYEVAVAEMEARAVAVAEGTARELIWLLEHPPVYTGGTSADPAELRDPQFPVIDTGRGGRYTYHGPGQRIGYVVLDLTRRGRDVRQFVHALEGWVIDTLGDLGIAAFRAPGRIGIWTMAPDALSPSGTAEAKIGAIGVRVRRWVTLHGFSVNLSPDLAHFGGIVPCGLADFAVTSAAALGAPTDFATFDTALALRLPAFLETHSLGRQNMA